MAFKTEKAVTEHIARILNLNHNLFLPLNPVKNWIKIMHRSKIKEEYNTKHPRSANAIVGKEKPL
ncbi:MAG: hypothetical protein COZ80_05825 [Ignavibacteria bacterium CG_4_8_14_3_um_filter_37_9]|nr:MAG: hypothetical protein AUJ54_06755 [Ignavibacteria bacterium CG1_02_37_35]PIW99363.1 MAG: hypothetical protein COZ80_05825 [Ignavibacteria bacterium CG_4_8_14_3_um_filter_37_9]PIX94065.1 MAG: hypothetical protein COZ25_07480 [Ignavibacteria bacterium CG_4_10_14_3_um_filter_37_18]